jgi:hypothetical protein
MCQHQPSCPPADVADREAAHVVISHLEQDWSLLCNSGLDSSLHPDRRVSR